MMYHKPQIVSEWDGLSLCLIINLVVYGSCKYIHLGMVYNWVTISVQ
jgi:hypothetical protein